MLLNLLNHKFSMIILFVILIIGLCFFKNKLNLNNKKQVTFNEDKNRILEHNKFIPSAKFEGKKEGYVFKKNDLGIGYYLDIKKNENL